VLVTAFSDLLQAGDIAVGVSAVDVIAALDTQQADNTLYAESVISDFREASLDTTQADNSLVAYGYTVYAADELICYTVVNYSDQLSITDYSSILATLNYSAENATDDVSTAYALTDVSALLETADYSTIYNLDDVSDAAAVRKVNECSGEYVIPTFVPPSYITASLTRAQTGDSISANAYISSDLARILWATFTVED
jgi:hypothetical protein